MAARFSFSLLAFALLVALASASVAEELGYSYLGSTGPKSWGILNPRFKPCSSGKYQSPVHILKNETVRNKNLKPLTRAYQPANATLVNNVFNIGIHYDENVGALLIDGKNYTLKQMHWHSPSEHYIDGVQFPLELHLLHQANDGSLSVVGILYQYGDSDPLVEKIKDSLDQLAKEKCAVDEVAQIPLGTLDTKHIRRNTRKYYRYIGSATTPPCTENVIWSVLGKVRSISEEQVEALKAPLGSDFKNNSRPLQPLNGRKIELFDELSDN